MNGQSGRSRSPCHAPRNSVSTEVEASDSADGRWSVSQKPDIYALWPVWVWNDSDASGEEGGQEARTDTPDAVESVGVTATDFHLIPDRHVMDGDMSRESVESQMLVPSGTSARGQLPSRLDWAETGMPIYIVRPDSDCSRAADGSATHIHGSSWDWRISGHPVSQNIPATAGGR